jgi:hypothetical protein
VENQFFIRIEVKLCGWGSRSARPWLLPEFESKIFSRLDLHGHRSDFAVLLKNIKLKRLCSFSRNDLLRMSQLSLASQQLSTEVNSEQRL